MTTFDLRTSVVSLRDFWLDVAKWIELRGETDTLTHREAATCLGDVLEHAAGDDVVRQLVLPPSRPVSILETEWTHSCRLELATWVEDDLNGMPAPGSIARCTCGRYFLVDDHGDRWVRVRWWNTRALAAIADYEERTR